MSTGQMYSGKGETTTQNPKNDSSVINPTVQSIDRTKSQVEAAISYLVKDYEGTDIPRSALHDLTAEINRIISQNFARPASVIPDACRPVYIRVPEYIAERLTDPDRLREEVKYAAEAMRDFARDRTSEGEEQQAHYDGVYDSILWILDMATNTLEGRGVPLDQAIKAEESKKPANTHSIAVVQISLPLATGKNSKNCPSEVGLVNLALRNLRYDLTRKLVHYAVEGDQDAPAVAYNLRMVDHISNRLFAEMEAIPEDINSYALGFCKEARAVVESGHEDNIKADFEAYYLDYEGDAERPGV